MALIKITEDKMQNDEVITLKDICDVLGRKKHAEDLRIIERLAEDPLFGTVRKISVVYNDRGQKIQTLALNKTQALAVAARLDNASLMKVVKRLEEMEAINGMAPSNALPTTLSEALLLTESLKEENDKLLIELKTKDETIEKLEQIQKNNETMVKAIMMSDSLFSATQLSMEFGISALLFNTIMVEAGVIRKVGGIYTLTSAYSGGKEPYAIIKQVNRKGAPRDASVKAFVWTSAGVEWCKENWPNAISRMSDKTRRKYELTMKRNSASHRIPMKRKKKEEA